MQELTVKIPGTTEKHYPILIGTGLLPSLWSRLESEVGRGAKFVVTDANLVAAGHLDALLAGRDVPHFVIEPAGEPSKTVETAVAIVEAMEKACLGRDTVVVALGGGTVGDIAGFAAAIFKRGVPVVQIPTTTLAQADSAIGGKTGVDSSVSKNAFGAFWHPAAVYIDTATLATLDERHYRGGLVESVKHALIADSGYFDFLERHLDEILKRKAEVLETVAGYNCRIKGAVVEADPQEKNERRTLNYGHTIGHAVEAASGYDLLHGEAVAVGIVAAGRIEAEMGLAEPGRRQRVQGILERLGVPVKLPPQIAEKKVLDLLKHDKKAVGQWPRFVLIARLGQAYCRDGQYAVDVERQIVENVLRKLK
ncbi:MAG: 3-dehydroquinate synthase [Sedimentisphaerales bacterium]|nr:3-dehydroquinate synthase [Sedimentisphaerales bacterium]